MHAQVSDPAFNLMLKTLLKHDVPEISVKEAVTRYNAVFLDARQKVEYDVSHIHGAHYVGYDDFDSARVKNLRKDFPVIVYCSVGYRSEKITEKLQQLGFTDIHNLYGGIFEWVNEGYKVYDDSGKETDKVHAYDHAWGIWLKKGEKVY
ncbi:MAG: rhodanese-like domain-containing protein [Chitinophagales bacterium]